MTQVVFVILIPSFCLPTRQTVQPEPDTTPSRRFAQVGDRTGLGSLRSR